ncbi:MAG: amino acid dehydrogenase [Planctomycetes bacterium]|nr:amino acid dehydrogenase [Planctomycetota bacterium]
MPQTQIENEFLQIIKDLPDYDQHHNVSLITDAQTGLQCFIAIHNIHRGPAVGGCRLWSYQNQSDALTDALRLSKGMTYKNAMAELPFGGGKSVIMAPDFSRYNRQDLMAAFGRAVESVEGAYCAAQDVGLHADDMNMISSQTKHIFGLAKNSGDPSPFTAYGCFLGLKEAVHHQLKTDSLSGIRVAVQGLGHVGYGLCTHLHNAGAELIVGDLRDDVCKKAQAEFGATIADAKTIHASDADVFAPCALGACINRQSIDELQVQIIAGAANNQLSHDDLAHNLKEKDILYTPDYVLNAGGIVNIACECGDYDPDVAQIEVEKIGPRLHEIFKRAQTQNCSTLHVANELAQSKFAVAEIAEVHTLQLNAKSV